MKLSDITIRPLYDTLQLLDISDEEYFSSKYRDYISNSKLSLINPRQKGSIEKYKQGFGGLYSDSLVFGSAVHGMILQPDDFILVDTVNRPTAKAGFMADELYPIYFKEGKVSFDDVVKASDKVEYYKGKMNSDKYDALILKCKDYWKERREYELTNSDEVRTPIYLDPKSREKLITCIESIRQNKEIQDLLHPEYILTEPISCNEYAVMIDVEVVAEGKEPLLFKLKSKLDNFTIHSDYNLVTLNDLKTTGHYIAQFQESWENFHYYRQMGKICPLI